MSLKIEDYLSNPEYRADNEGKREFGLRLMLAFKQKNLSEGIQWYQSVYLHARLRSWVVAMPDAVGGGTETVDLLNMILSGDIESACLSAQFGMADDMTEPRHWVTQERIDWCVNEMKKFLGWT
jgi:hypothetical protein